MTFMLVMLHDTLPPDRYDISYVSIYFAILLMVIGWIICESIVVYRIFHCCSASSVEKRLVSCSLDRQLIDYHN